MKKIIFIVILVVLSANLAAQSRYSVNLSGEGWKLWLDKDADWQNEELYFTPADINKIKTHVPTAGWDVISSEKAVNIYVPGTTEEFLQTVTGPEGDITGVSWWTRQFSLPDYDKNSRIILKFEAIRHRAEIFINRQPAGYEIVGNTPFEVDITDMVCPESTAELSVRITDPGGNFDWRDGSKITWGSKQLPPSHGFGGIYGNVSLEIQHPVAVTDLYIQNLPQIKDINAHINISNRSGKKVKRDISISICEWKNQEKIIYETTLKNIAINNGEQEIISNITVPDALLWELDSPNLYVCNVELIDRGRVTDQQQRRFGFRWFDVEGIGDDAIFTLNGKRIVLRTSISWSYWPASSLYPTDQQARRQIESAKQLGLNMLNFHRNIGNTKVLDYADELGLLFYQEPGGYRTGTDEFLQFMLREKVLRMVKRDRSHPSLVMYNMMNESGSSPAEILEIQMKDMAAMHKADASRIITRTSSWAPAYEIDDQSKIHLRPLDTTFYWNGWYDNHQAGGPSSWTQDFYKSPNDYYHNISNKKEIVMFGEEGALTAPPRLAKDKQEIEKMKFKGWDTRGYLEWYDRFDNLIDRQNLRHIFPTVDELTVAMSRVSYEHQGHKIQLARMNNITDSYAINGWESELIDNFSGVVDCFRFPKAEPSIIAKYNRPLYIAVQPRKLVINSGDNITVDFYIINEKDIKGNKQLEISIIDNNGNIVARHTSKVNVSGGNTYGELLCAEISLPTQKDSEGMHKISASLKELDGQFIADGSEDFLTVNLSANKLEGNGAVMENGTALKEFLKDKTDKEVKSYNDTLGKLDWIIVSSPATKNDMSLIPAVVFTTHDGRKGLELSYYNDTEFKQHAATEITQTINSSVVEGANPHVKVPKIEFYGLLWRGKLTPRTSGIHKFHINTSGKTYSLSINGRTIANNIDKDGEIELVENESVDIEVCYSHARGGFYFNLDWSEPLKDYPLADKLLERAEKDGTTIFIIDNVKSWIPSIEKVSDAEFGEEFSVGIAWLGGCMFNVEHPLFNGLPVNSGMNWPYQAVVRNGGDRTGFVMNGEKLIVGAYHSYPMNIGTAVGELTSGEKGKIIFSTLDLYDNIIDEQNNTSALVARKILFNAIDYAK